MTADDDRELFMDTPGNPQLQNTDPGLGHTWDSWWQRWREARRDEARSQRAAALREAEIAGATEALMRERFAQLEAQGADRERERVAATPPPIATAYVVAGRRAGVRVVSDQAEALQLAKHWHGTVTELPLLADYRDDPAPLPPHPDNTACPGNRGVFWAWTEEETASTVRPADPVQLLDVHRLTCGCWWIYWRPADPEDIRADLAGARERLATSERARNSLEEVVDTLTEKLRKADLEIQRADKMLAQLASDTILAHVEVPRHVRTCQMSGCTVYVSDDYTNMGYAPNNSHNGWCSKHCPLCFGLRPGEVDAPLSDSSEGGGS